MKAILYRPSGAMLTDMDVPPVGAGEALVAVDACGVCGTDLMKLASKPPAAVLGHEVAGRISKLGKGAKGLREGDAVVVAHHVPCGRCHYCRRGSVSQCRQFKRTNIEPGGFAEFVRVSPLHLEGAVLRIPEGLDPVHASQTEPLACCLRNVKRLALGEGDVVGLIGLGAIGLLTAQLLALRKISVLGLDLDLARAQGLSPWGRGFTDAPAFTQALKQATEGRGLDALVVSAGPAAQLGERLSWIRDGGTLNVFASFHPPESAVDWNQVYHRELTVMSSYSPAPEDLRESLDLIAEGAVRIDALSPKCYALEEFPVAEADVRARRVLKAVLTP